MADRITWYDILGISPGASSDTVRRAYQDKAQQLERDWFASAPPEVIVAAARGRKALDAAWLVLGDRAERERYDRQIGIDSKGTGLVRPEPASLRPVQDPPDAGSAVGALDPGGVLTGLAAALAGLGALADWLTPPARTSRRQSRDVIVPDVRGLFASACQDALATAGFRISTVLLTNRPMPVEGLVVGQSPAPGEKVPRFSTLAIQVWHPPRRQGRYWSGPG